MSKLALFNVYINERLTAAAVEIVGAVERTIIDYQEEIYRSKEEIGRLRLLLGYKTQIQSHRADNQQIPLEWQHCEQKRGHGDSELTQIKDEQEELYPNREKEQFEGLESDTNDSIFTVCEERDSYPTFPSKEINFPSQTSESTEGGVLRIRLPQGIKTEPDGQCCTVLEGTSASQCLSDERPGYSVAQNENSGSDNEMQSEWRPSGSEMQKSPRKWTKQGVLAQTSAGDGEPTGAADYPYCCKLCGSTFVYIGPLVNHVKNVHTKLTTEYRCGVCEEVFESVTSLTDHLQTHIKATRTCNVCGKCFPSDSSMRIHMVSHTGEKQYQCKACWKCFKTKGYMHLHMRRHTGATPFRCLKCGDRFICKGSLKAHMEFHASEDPQSTPELGTGQDGKQLEGLESDAKDSIFTVCEESDCDPKDLSVQTSQTGQGDVHWVPIPEEIKTEPEGECYTVSDETSASQSLSEGYPGYSAAQSENSESDNEVESGGPRIFNSLARVGKKEESFACEIRTRCLSILHFGSGEKF
ncbi:hypothetical protein DPEC_G00285480 [Dallia pectoralis]|uniref:Uncharacterized protein n=1 Tax=Dallia pectoralis TaxID=75939 RepID=A0ACC2FJT4_DALPE|nr:hypothetical protein DPEC_G00285480 [Dallia pectoralis]